MDIGIDFGTTNCALGRVKKTGSTFVIGPYPSVVGWANGNCRYGKKAKRALRKDREQIHAIRDLKLKLGKSDIKIGSHPLCPIDLSRGMLASFVDKLRGGANLGTAVIGTPVRFSLERRQALRKTLLDIGFEKVRLVYEPTAAIIGNRKDDPMGDQDTVLVVDWGGGTLDIAVIKVERDRFREIGVGGDVKSLGGTQIDKEITNRLLQEPEHRAAKDDISNLPGGFERLKEYVEDEKIGILTDLDGVQAAPSAMLVSWLTNGQLTLQPGLVFEVVREFARYARQEIVKTIERFNLSDKDITHILFAGGTCMTPVVRDEIRKAFPKATVMDDANPQLLTAIGCTWLTHRNFEVELAADLAVRQCDDSLCVMLKRGEEVQLNAFRSAEFLVTHPQAQHAVLDLGICNIDPNEIVIHAVASGGFTSLDEQILLRVGNTQIKAGVTAMESVLLHAGIEENLTVAIDARSNLGQDVWKANLHGIPLAIRIHP